MDDTIQCFSIRADDLGKELETGLNELLKSEDLAELLFMQRLRSVIEIRTEEPEIQVREIERVIDIENSVRSRLVSKTEVLKFLKLIADK